MSLTDTGQAHERTLRIVPERDDSRAEAGPAMSADDRRLLEVVRRLAIVPSGLAPASARVLSGLWPRDMAPAPPLPRLEGALTRLVTSGSLRRVVVGVEPHLTLPEPGGAPHTSAAWSQAPAQERRTHAMALAEPDEQVAFDLQVAVDVEHERVLLFRVLLVLEAVGAFVLARELLLAWLG